MTILIQGIREVNDDSPMRQGMRNAYYGKRLRGDEEALWRILRPVRFYLCISRRGADWLFASRLPRRNRIDLEFNHEAESFR